MAEETTSPRQPKPAGIGRFGIGINVLLQTAAVLAIVGAANYAGCRHHRSWDLSSSRQFTLSEQTTELIGALDQKVTLVVAFRRRLELTRYVNRMVESYERAGEGRVEVRHFDPELDPSTAQERSLRFNNLRFDENLIVVEPEKGSFRVIREREIVEREDNQPEGRILGFQLEKALTAAIVAATQREQQKIYLVSDKGRMRSVREGNPMGVLVAYGQRQNMLVETLQLSGVTSIPEDASGLVLLAPSIDLTGREVAMLRRWWDESHAGLLILLDPQAETANLAAFLREYGVSPRDDRVLTTVDSGGVPRKEFVVSALFLEGSPILRGLERGNTELNGQSCSLNVRENDPSLAARNIRTQPLIIAGAAFWGETDYRATAVQRDVRDTRNSLFLAAGVEKGSLAAGEVTINSSRMVVVSNGTLLDPDRTTRANALFVTNAINWMTDRELLLGIGPRRVEEFRVFLTDEQISRMTLWVTRILPAGVFGFGLLVWFRRRH
ncbi:MAG TPA: Gldg family protein [Verrucomicrobiales bacterium]|nr:Gldg family protein [Verrucomicrobiales bacterium]